MKDLPYFKFVVSEWLNGDITLEDFEIQGIFINVCSLYWHKSGNITLTEIKRRLKTAKPNAFDSLIESNLIKVKNDLISISFLDEQFIDRGYVSDVNSKNGKKGGRPKGSKTKEKKPNALFSESEPLTKKSNIEEKREEKRRKEKSENKRKFVPPSLQEIKTYFDDNGYSAIAAEKAFRYYETANWHDSKNNAVKNWKQKMQGVWFKPENEKIKNIAEKASALSQKIAKGIFDV